jgi:integrase/recombinase XerD
VGRKISEAADGTCDRRRNEGTIPSGHRSAASGSETIRKYKSLLRAFESFRKNRQVHFLNEIDVAVLSDFRATWTIQPITASKRLASLCTIFAFAISRGWLRDNPAKPLKMPKVKHVPTMPFSDAEMKRIWDVLEKMDHDPLIAFVGVMVHAGLRISDAATLKVNSLRVNQLTGSSLFLRTAKTGEHVYCPLPEHITEALKRVIPKNDLYYFWSGRSKLASITSVWRKRLAEVFKEAKIEDGHAHRFRDTFACQMLTAGVPLENVAALLGHSSIKVTEKSYAPWIKTRQTVLEMQLRRVINTGSLFELLEA